METAHHLISNARVWTDPFLKTQLSRARRRSRQGRRLRAKTLCGAIVLMDDSKARI